MKTDNSAFLNIHAEVAAALSDGKPIVALESTIIAHGMPYPQNVETAKRVEETVRSTGAIPATIAIIDGKMKVGLSSDELELLGSPTQRVVKCSRRDLPIIMARGQHGATTVASTMIIAEIAGIHIFGTGGIGGVHRGAPHSFDISADLQEFARTNVAVVSSGIKSILDIGLTLEYLETHGVPVIGYGTDFFPAFYTRDSGFPVDYRINTPKEIAKVLDMKWNTGLKGGLLIANPIPSQYEIENQSINTAIDQAIIESQQKGITGKAITPFLLARITELTGGESLKSNIQLVLNNVRLAGEVAVEYAAASR